MARRLAWYRRSWKPPTLARGLLIVLVAVVVSMVGYHALRFARSCVTLDGAREVIESHVKNRQVRRIARVLKAADREILAARTEVRVTTLTCGPSLLGGMTCRARYLVNGRSAGVEAADHYFRLGHSLLAGWHATGVIETSGLRYSLAPCRCSWAADDR
ncbi:MAG: hypothetical protein WEG40_09750 [Candidatus Rokuibacteriota bacterium]